MNLIGNKDRNKENQVSNEIYKLSIDHTTANLNQIEYDGNVR
jgi:hypothetical protein